MPALSLSGLYLNLINRSTLQGGKYVWPTEMVLTVLDIAGIIDLTVVDNGADLSGVDVSHIVYEDSAVPKDAPGTVKIYDTANTAWVTMTPALFAELFSDQGQVQANWNETDTNVASYIENRPPNGDAAAFLAATENRLLLAEPVWDALEEEVVSIAAGEIDIDLSDGIDFSVAMDQNAELQDFSNKKVGQRGIIRFVQDATGSRLLTFAAGAPFEFVNSSAFALSTAANAQDEVSYRVITGGTVRLAIDKNWG